MMTPLDKANAEQRAASNPAVSAFVAASAGTGKTKLLTDRLLRLMLAGTRPEKILCLTYTKAAAAEMTIRLNRRLGEWVVLPDHKLDAKLYDLDVAPTAESRARARKLFADVLDLPGGMRIETIHAFCQSLLRRFPLEAGLSPHFELADDNAAAGRLRESRETVLARPDHRAAILALAAETDEQNFASLTTDFASSEHDLQDLLRRYGAQGVAEMQRAALAAGDAEHDDVVRAAVSWEREHHVASALKRLAEQGNPSGQKFALKNLEWLAHEAENRFLRWVHWVDGHFKTDGDRRKTEGFYGKALAADRAALNQEIAAEHDRIEQIEEARKAAKLCRLNSHLTELLAPILQTDATAKTAAATLGYADLIARTAELLKDPGAAWILYKLDGGIDHLLLDEVQDTAPAQWNIAYAIADEFFAGAGARDAPREAPRSIFAVGDPKQSIFSFQGADLASFETYRTKFRNRVSDAGQKFLDGELSVSFRSTAPVLALVDAVFAAGPACEGVCPPATLRHDVLRLGQAGAVTLWPLTAPASVAPAPDWGVPDDYAGADSAKAILAKQIAAYIKNLLDTATFLPSRNRAFTPGDFLILVRRRDELVGAITRECKAARIPIAGADRIALTAEQAVSDLMALCDALLLPEDDLAFGQFLASPLGGLTDDEIMRLAIGRRSTLAAALYANRETYPAAHAFFETLRQQTDFVAPHALLAQALGPLGGRALLLARLGQQAAEPIDELLAEALAFARREPGSLQGFLHQLRQSGAQIKREADAGGNLVRIMTVHGAKGLQAPIVILPDTTSLPKPGGGTKNLLWLHPPQQPDVAVPIFCPRTALRSDAVTQAHAAQTAAERAEYNRLLYVALTRAEDELIICGAAPKNKMPEACWYELIAAGFGRLPAAAASPDSKITYATPQTGAADRAETSAAAQNPVLPGWAGAAPSWSATPLARETTRPEPLAPSRATEAEEKRAIATSPLGGGLAIARAAREAALAKGRAIHALLQHLPDVPAPRRRRAGKHFLARNLELEASSRATILGSVLAILEDPALSRLFGPGSRAEVPLAGIVNDVEIGGLVDRLAITEAQILLADYKTDRAPPATPAEIPAAYLGQLAAYQAILAQIFPAIPISCLLIFTQTAAIMPVPPALLASHAPA